MLILRLLLLFVIIVSVVLLGFYFLFGEEKYLRYFKQTIKLTMYLAVLFGIATIVDRLVF